MDAISPGAGSTTTTAHGGATPHAQRPQSVDPAEVKARLRRRILLTRRTFPPRTAGPGWPDGTGWPDGAGGQQPAPGGWRSSARERAATAITRRILELPDVDGARCVAAYVSLADEPGTSELLVMLRKRGKRVLLPALRADLDLDFREYTGVLVPGAMGTSEPPPAGPVVRLEEADVVITPALAADRSGHRLGRGGGSYDRALGVTRDAALTIAVVYDHELVDVLPCEEHDRRVRMVVTPERVWHCHYEA